MKTLLFKLQISFEITIITGLHIGGSKMDLNIGGIDNPVIKDPNGIPYIPGSSLKGKMRSLLERVGVDINIIKELFGVGANDKRNKENLVYSRLLFEDMYPKLNKTGTTYKAFENAMMEMPYTEVKHENSINRFNAKAEPRQIERVPRDAVFTGKITLDYYNNDSLENYLKMIDNGFDFLEIDYLGGSGSRGYGRISIKDIKCQGIKLLNDIANYSEIINSAKPEKWKNL
ncbi:MAG: type III-A CRISPR-associated RAMP protein Csm3 [Bacteroidetes bacterium]|nr:type III-A CRISPR-associated RAMP protein Csm3 [Bacteroidota bacterium]